ncbi:hypothetical protein AMTRI_Chr06g197150 [Amborella trichopoda]
MRDFSSRLCPYYSRVFILLLLFGVMALLLLLVSIYCFPYSSSRLRPVDDISFRLPYSQGFVVEVNLTEKEKNDFSIFDALNDTTTRTRSNISRTNTSETGGASNSKKVEVVPLLSNVGIPKSIMKLEAGLSKARAAIREATLSHRNRTPIEDPDDYAPKGGIYRNSYAFHRSYLEMEKRFKIFVYEEGEPPLVHNGPCKSIYSSEGIFIHEMVLGNRFRTRSQERAHVHFLPFSVVAMIQFVYTPSSFDLYPVKNLVADYIDVISKKYHYWNQSLGADHFMLSCHDWGPHTSAANPLLNKNSIRVLCNANSSEDFYPQRDVPLPEINIPSGSIEGMLGGLRPSARTILAFFAGGVHGWIRSILLQHWKNKDPDIQAFEYLPHDLSYWDMLRKSKFCLCPSGYEVASPRLVEAIYAECVPVIISDHYVLPFSDVLNWASFSVEVKVGEIERLKEILEGISMEKYVRMQRRVKQVQRHFVVNEPPKRYDVFHMVIHSVWLRRLNLKLHL